MVQINGSNLNVRIKFTKTGALQYISHLDLVRTMHKVVVRAKLPLWYTEGFNPKPKMVFAAPLSIGTESRTEFMDLRITKYVPEKEIIEALNKNLTDEMRVIDAYYPETKLTDLKWLSYTILVKTAKPCDGTLAECCERALRSEIVEIEKKSKPGEAKKTVNIAPLIKSVNVAAVDNGLQISTCLSADQSSFLNPEYIISALKNQCGILNSCDLISEYYSIMREFAYRDDMSEFR